MERSGRGIERRRINHSNATCIFERVNLSVCPAHLSLRELADLGVQRASPTQEIVNHSKFQLRSCRSLYLYLPSV